MAKQEKKIDEITVENVAEKAPEKATETIKIIVAVDSLNPNNKKVHCGINGVFYELERGVETEVPLQVAIVLREGGYPVSTAF